MNAKRFFKVRGRRRIVAITAIALLLLCVASHLLSPTVCVAHESAKRAHCQSNIRQIGLACKQYSVNHRDRFPIRLTELIDGGYLNLSEVFLCPDDLALKKLLAKENLDALSSYFLVKNLKESDSSDSPLILEKPNHHGGDGGNVFYVGGHAAWVKADKLEQLYKEAGIQVPTRAPDKK